VPFLATLRNKPRLEKRAHCRRSARPSQPSPTISSAVQNGQICRLPSVQTKELRLPLLPNVVRFASRMFMRTIAQ